MTCRVLGMAWPQFARLPGPRIRSREFPRSGKRRQAGDSTGTPPDTYPASPSPVHSHAFQKQTERAISGSAGGFQVTLAKLDVCEAGGGIAKAFQFLHAH